jgi:hypothetical protein
MPCYERCRLALAFRLRRLEKSADSAAPNSLYTEQVMQFSDATHGSLPVNVMAPEGASLARPIEPNRLETLRQVQNEADSGPGRLALSATSSVMPTLRQIASGLIGIAMLPLTSAYPNEDGGEVAGLVAVGGNAVAVRGYEAAQLLRHSPVFWTTALITTTLTIGGVALRLLRSSTSPESPAAEAQYSLGPTVISACGNFADEIPDADSVTVYSPTLDEVRQLDRSTDDLLAMVRGEICSGTQAPSLEQIRQCIDQDIKTTKLQPLSDELFMLKLQTEIGWTGIAPTNLVRFKKRIIDKMAVVEGITAKITQGIEQIDAEINRQRAGVIG